MAVCVQCGKTIWAAEGDPCICSCQKKPLTTESKELKCKFCRVKVKRWRRVGKRTIDGWDTLKNHVLLYHPEEEDKMEMTW